MKVAAPLDLDGNGITSVAVPVNPSDAANKSYADSVAGASTFISGLLGNGSATTLTVTHNLGTTTPMIGVWDVSGASPVWLLTDAVAVDADTVSLTFDPAPATWSVKAVVMAPGTGTGGGAGAGGISPPAGDIGGTAASPAVVSTHLSAALPADQGGTGTGTAPQNGVFAGPAAGGAGTPSFRTLTTADVPWAPVQI